MPAPFPHFDYPTFKKLAETLGQPDGLTPLLKQLRTPELTDEELAELLNLLERKQRIYINLKYSPAQLHVDYHSKLFALNQALSALLTP